MSDQLLLLLRGLTRMYTVDSLEAIVDWRRGVYVEEIVDKLR
jgi:hypothetical protein